RASGLAGRSDAKPTTSCQEGARGLPRPLLTRLLARRVRAAVAVVFLLVLEFDEQRHAALRQAVDRLHDGDKGVGLVAQARRQGAIVDRVSPEWIWARVEPRQLAAGIVIAPRFDRPMAIDVLDRAVQDTDRPLPRLTRREQNRRPLERIGARHLEAGLKTRDEVNHDLPRPRRVDVASNQVDVDKAAETDLDIAEVRQHALVVAVWIAGGGHEGLDTEVMAHP